MKSAGHDLSVSLVVIRRTFRRAQLLYVRTSACECSCVHTTDERRAIIMKSQKAQGVGERKPRPVMGSQFDTATPSSKPARHARPSFDDLHARIATRAYELYVQRGCREACAEEDWLDAEREIVSREFPVSSNSGRGDSL